MYNARANRASLTLIYLCKTLRFDSPFKCKLDDLYFAIVDSGLYVMLMNNLPHCPNQAILWSFLCDCGQFAFDYRYECGQKNIVDVDNLLLQANHQSQENPYLLFMLHSILDSICLDSNRIELLWEYLKRVVSSTNDFESFLSLLQYCDQFPNESVLKMILTTLKKRFVRLPLSFHTHSSSAEIQSLIQYCMFNGVEPRGSSTPKSPSLFKASPALWTVKCFETKVGTVSTAMEEVLRIDS